TAKQHLIVRLDKRASKLVDEKNREFARSLLKQWVRYGELSGNQWHWVRRLLKCPVVNETPKNSEHFVYAIRSADLVKIGFAADPRKRMKAIQTGNPEAVEVVYLEKHPTRGAAKVREAELHKRLKAFAVRGEWFKAEALQRVAW